MQSQLEVIKSILGVSQGHVYIVLLTSASSAAPLIARIRILFKLPQITEETLKL